MEKQTAISKPAKLVFVDSKANELFTTSEAIAKYADIKHRAVQQLIAKYEADIKDLGGFSI